MDNNSMEEDRPPGKSPLTPTQIHWMKETLVDRYRDILELKASITLMCKSVMELSADMLELREEVKTLFPRASSCHQAAFEREDRRTHLCQDRLVSSKQSQVDLGEISQVHLTMGEQVVPAPPCPVPQVPSIVQPVIFPKLKTPTVTLWHKMELARLMIYCRDSTIVETLIAWLSSRSSCCCSPI